MSLVPREKALETLDGDRPRCRLFIAGCARSGTTLLLAMMRCLDKTHVEMNERPASFFAHMQSGQSVHVCKRTHRCWRTLHRIPASIKIIYVVRHPYDVLTSHHPNFPRRTYTSLERWVNEFDAFERLCTQRRSEEDLLLVRYEDLVRRPAEIQRQMETLWGLTSRLPFGRFPEAVEPAAAPRKGMELALRGLRRPDTRSLEKWRRSTRLADDIQELVAREPAKLGEFLDRFGYDRDEFDFTAEPSGSRGVEEENGTGSFWELRDAIADVVPEGEAFVLVGTEWFEKDLVPRRRSVYFRQRDGQYWGLPPDDAGAIREVERSRRAGVRFVVFPWSGFWCLEHYAGFSRYLRAEFSCVVDDERMVVFDLCSRAAATAGQDARLSND